MEPPLAPVTVTQLGAPTIVKRFNCPVQPPRSTPHTSILSVLQSSIHDDPPIIATLPHPSAAFTLSHISIDASSQQHLSIPTLSAPFPPTTHLHLHPPPFPHQIETQTRPHHPHYFVHHNSFTKSTNLPFNHYFNQIYVSALTPLGDFSVYNVSPTKVRGIKSEVTKL